MWCLLLCPWVLLVPISIKAQVLQWLWDLVPQFLLLWWCSALPFLVHASAFPPQGLCTGCLLCPECTSFSCVYGSFSSLLRISAQVRLSYSDHSVEISAQSPHSLWCSPCSSATFWHTQSFLAQSLQSCPDLCNSMDCDLPGSSVYGSLQAKILEWVAMPSSRWSSWPRVQTHVPCIAGKFFTTEPLGKSQSFHRYWLLSLLIHLKRSLHSSSVKGQIVTT